jgi:hypothetical protein
MTASPGDWIIKGVAGEIYPCKPDIFAATYEDAAKASPDHLATITALEAEVGRLRAELEEAREVARTITRYWPHGRDNTLDAAVAQALCAIADPSATLKTKEPDQ